MTGDAARSWVLGSWLAVAALTTVKQVSQRPGLPQPGAYLGSAVLFTLFFGLAGLAPGLTAALAAGTVVGVAVAPYLKGKTTGVLDQAATWLDGVSGATASGQVPQPGSTFDITSH